MVVTSFPYRSPRVYPRRARLTPSILAASVAFTVVAGGCGGSGSSAGETGQPVPMKTVSGPGFTFRAPETREIARTPRSVTVLPAESGSQELESVTIFRLVKPFRPALWPQAANELDGVAGRLAQSLGGELEREETVRIAGLRGRRYEIAYTRDGADLRQRLTLLLARRTEYQLLCRWEATAAPPDACADMETTFQLK
jgi:hypothetical protein